jgi:hypothetical protein
MISTATDQFDDDTPLATDLQQFAYLANNLVELLETAKYALEPDREAAKASLVTASSILRSEIERRSRAKGARPSPLAAWQTARALSSTRICAAKSTRRRGEAKPISLGPSKKPSEKHRTLTWRANGWRGRVI